MRRSFITAIVVLAVVMTGGMLLTPVATVQLVTGDGEVLACQRVSPGTAVTLRFTHSMYGGDVTETWLADGDMLRRQSIVTDNAAAAEYYAWDGRVERHGDRFEVLAGPLSVAAIAVRVDQIGRHRISIGTTTHDLAAMVDGSAQVWIEPATALLVTGPPC